MESKKCTFFKVKTIWEIIWYGIIAMQQDEMFSKVITYSKEF